jgi:phosphomannomutase
VTDEDPWWGTPPFQKDDRIFSIRVSNFKQTFYVFHPYISMLLSGRAPTSNPVRKGARSLGFAKAKNGIPETSGASRRVSNLREYVVRSSTTSTTSTPPSSPSMDLKTAFYRLQNGSDIRGVALDLVDDEPVTLTPARAFYIGAGFARWLKARKSVDGTPSPSLRVSIGNDPRLSSDLLSASIAAGIASEGVNVLQFGICTTPAMFMSCILEKHACDAGIMVTASHLPANRNGAKFFLPEGGLGKPDIKEILELSFTAAEQDGLLGAGSAWWVDHAIVAQRGLGVDASLIRQDKSFLSDYASFLRQIVIGECGIGPKPLQGLRIVVNPGNGSGGFFATEVLGPLGADVSHSINLQPDGTFPAHQPNPEDKGAVKATTEAVLKSSADLGIMLDTDVDRSGFIDKNGNPINRNRYIALAAAIALKKNPGATIVTDSCTSNGLKSFIEGLGGKHFRFKKGYKNIIDKGIELNEAGVDCPLMMETSGHGALRENYFLDDGAYGALKIVIEAVKRRLDGGQDIAELLETLKEPQEAMEIRFRITAEDVRGEGERVTAAFKEWMASGNAPTSWKMEDENYEGWRVSIDEGDGDQGWLLVRPSLHDPDVVINVESEQAGGMKRHLADLLTMDFASYQVSTEAVEKYVRS